MPSKLADSEPDSAAISPESAPEYWRGAYAWVGEASGGSRWLRPWRLDPDRARTAHAPDLLEMAQMAAGVRLDMVTNARTLRLPVRFRGEPGVIGVRYALDLVVDGAVERTDIFDGADRTFRWSLPGKRARVSLWLPQAGYTEIGAATLVGADLQYEPVPQPKWITYGSSITQCHGAAGPSETWPAVAAAQLGWDLTCLGFSGQCQLDPIAYRSIAGLEADVISLCLGINSYNGSAFSPRTFKAQVCGFIEQVRAAHPGIPIAIVTPIGSPGRENALNAVGHTLADVRREVGEAYASMATSDGQLHLIDGLEILHLEEADLLPDGLHPGPEGYRLMGERIAGKLAPLASDSAGGA